MADLSKMYGNKNTKKTNKSSTPKINVGNGVQKTSEKTKLIDVGPQIEIVDPIYISNLEEQINDQEKRIKKLESKLKQTERENKKLSEQVDRHDREMKRIFKG